MPDNGKTPNGLDKRIEAAYLTERLSALDAAADEIFTILCREIDRMAPHRKLNVRALLAVARAVTAKMYLAMDWQEQQESERISKLMMGRINWIGAQTRGGILKP